MSKINATPAHPFGGVTNDAIGENLPLDLSESTGAYRSMKGFDNAPFERPSANNSCMWRTVMASIKTIHQRKETLKTIFTV
jgi:hypothetical protein